MLIKKIFLLVFSVLLLCSLVGCGTKMNLVKFAIRDPLPSDAPVGFVYAPITPVVPESAEHIATMRTKIAVRCFAPIHTLEVRARELGANMVFVKSMQSRGEVCRVLLVDFYSYVPGGLGEKD